MTRTISSFIWSVADLLRGSYKQSEYGRVILPFAVLRRLDCVPEPHFDFATQITRLAKAGLLYLVANHEKIKVGYEIRFDRHFCVFKPRRPLAEIDAELKVVTDRIVAMIGELSK